MFLDKFQVSLHVSSIPVYCIWVAVKNAEVTALFFLKIHLGKYNVYMTQCCLTPNKQPLKQYHEEDINFMMR